MSRHGPLNAHVSATPRICLAAHTLVTNSSTTVRPLNDSVPRANHPVRAEAVVRCHETSATDLCGGVRDACVGVKRARAVVRREMSRSRYAVGTGAYVDVEAAAHRLKMNVDVDAIAAGPPVVVAHACRPEGNWCSGRTHGTCLRRQKPHQLSCVWKELLRQREVWWEQRPPSSSPPPVSSGSQMEELSN